MLPILMTSCHFRINELQVLIRVEFKLINIRSNFISERMRHYG